MTFIIASHGQDFARLDGVKQLHFGEFPHYAGFAITEQISAQLAHVSAVQNPVGDALRRQFGRAVANVFHAYFFFPFIMSWTHFVGGKMNAATAATAMKNTRSNTNKAMGVSYRSFQNRTTTWAG